MRHLTRKIAASDALIGGSIQDAKVCDGENNFPIESDDDAQLLCLRQT